MASLFLSSNVFLTLLLCSAAIANPVRRAQLAKRDPSGDVLNGANFPDPSLLTVDGTTYVFGTDSGGLNIQMASNPNFSNTGGWTLSPDDAMPSASFPSWVTPDSGGNLEIWSPDINQLTDYDDSFAMYYAGLTEYGVHCLGLARNADSVTGPFTDGSSSSFICPYEDGGAIDPAGFLDADGSRYLAYKIDGPAKAGYYGSWCNNTSNPPSTNTSLMLQQFESDGYTPVGTPIVLYNNAGASDNYNIEAPSIVLSTDGTTYFLFFSSGCTSDNSYTVSYVTSTTGVTGPYDDRQVLLSTGDFGFFGPGGADVSLVGLQMVFHSLQINDSISGPRILHTATLTTEGQTASIN